MSIGTDHDLQEEKGDGDLERDQEVEVILGTNQEAEEIDPEIDIKNLYFFLFIILFYFINYYFIFYYMYFLFFLFYYLPIIYNLLLF